tara:strand:+ start:292 stop:489 length:198 start_codon:yes stop_codon:yes gene_type:complete
MANKKKLNEASISGFINRFLDDMQKGTQDRFIKQAKKKGVPPKVTYRLVKIEKEIADLQNILRDL